jgi:hypothetical protein
MKGANRDGVEKSYEFFHKIGYFPQDAAVSRKKLDALMDDMTAIGDTDGKVPFDKLVLPGITKIED